MMSRVSQVLKDDGARREAISLHNRSILVEAGAGSGKTAVMAGRIAAMLAEGVAPRSIAAVTFTELAASELLSRVREFVVDLTAGTITTELRVALPEGLSLSHRDNLAAASAAIDEITCTTIHGFCQHLIKPYPAEADIDPGARVMDRNQADLVFFEIVEGWLRERLSGDQSDILAEMVLHSPRETVELIHKIAENLRRRPTLSAPPVSPLSDHVTVCQQASVNFADFMDGAVVVEPETATIVEQLVEMATISASGPDLATPAGLVYLLTLRPHSDLCTAKGEFRSYRGRKGKWADAARQAGLSKADGDRLHDMAETHYKACCEAWVQLGQAAAGHALVALIDEGYSILQRYREHKRASAQLDFDDLIFAARDLLRDHNAVRRALGQRFAHVLVDEFQDTDPLQAEIFWRLCGEPAEGDDNWTRFQIRPGALFLVGDPKQAIYRFRGADVGAYVLARDSFHTQDPGSLLSISTNFRSCASILTFVNERFEAVLSANGQPGFTALDPFHEDHGGLCVAALDIAAADENGQASADQQRDAEADAIADLCAKLIQSHPIIDRRSGAERPCQPGDIALLAPSGADLWRYEEALERRGIPVATQAGKGLFRRQEIQDLIALTRVLADRRDTLALGALLRGPLVGLTEEDLLDIVWALPRPDDQPDRIPRLDIGIDSTHIAHPLARETIERLQSLFRRNNSTTPHELLSRAVEVMRVRPILLERHRGHAERALANVDLYLSLSTGYAVRGLSAFAESMTAAWSDEARAVEGRPDAQEEAVALFTMHAAKGLEWPVVIPINTMTRIMPPERAIIDRRTETFYCRVLGVTPEGYETARQAEKEELDRERIRLWYVAATRARELLILPRLDTTPSNSAWIGLIDLSLADLPSLNVSHLPNGLTATGVGAENTQTRAQFAVEAEAIAAAHKRLIWRAPSRDEGTAGGVLMEEEVALWTGSDENRELEAVGLVQGGRGRGVVLHKLMEEILTGETAEVEAALIERATDLIRGLGQIPVVNPAEGLSPKELASCVFRTLSLPEVSTLRPELLAEFPVYATQTVDGVETVTAGIVDAMTFANDGRPAVVVDWKSDVTPSSQLLDHYYAQVRAYVDMTGAERGLIVLMTSGAVIHVQPTHWPVKGIA